MVRFMPIWTDTGVPPTSIVVLPLRYQPSEPVENSFTSACRGTPFTVTVTGLALLRKSPRLMGQLVFFAMRILPKRAKLTRELDYASRKTGGGIIPRLGGAARCIPAAARETQPAGIIPSFSPLGIWIRMAIPMQDRSLESREVSRRL